MPYQTLTQPNNDTTIGENTLWSPREIGSIAANSTDTSAEGAVAHDNDSNLVLWAQACQDLFMSNEHGTDQGETEDHQSPGAPGTPAVTELNSTTSVVVDDQAIPNLTR